MSLVTLTFITLLIWAILGIWILLDRIFGGDRQEIVILLQKEEE